MTLHSRKDTRFGLVAYDQTQCMRARTPMSTPTNTNAMRCVVGTCFSRSTLGAWCEQTIFRTVS